MPLEYPYSNTNCSWDFGFDANAVQKSNTLSYLQNGFMRTFGDQSWIHTPVNLPGGFTVQFQVFDVTHPDGSASGYVPIGAQITFTSAEVGGAFYPFQEILEIQLGNGTKTQLQVSVATATIKISPASFDYSHTPVPKPGQSGHFGPGSQQTFPLWPIVPSLTLLNDGTTGRFQFTVAVTVENAAGDQRTFVAESLMILGTFG
jgi:hypothetical protein